MTIAVFRSRIRGRADIHLSRRQRLAFARTYRRPLYFAGSPTIAGLLRGALQARAMFAGSFIGRLQPAGAIAGQASMMGRLFPLRALDGSIGCETELAAAPALRLNLSGAVQSTTTLTGTVTLEEPGVMALAGAVTAGSVIVGEATARLALEGAVSGLVSIAGAPVLNTTIGGAISAGTVVNGAVSPRIHLSGEITAGADIAGAVTLEVPGVTSLAGDVSASAEISGEVATRLNLSGSVSAMASMTGDASLGMSASGAIAAAATVLGSPDLVLPAAGGISATGVIAGDITSELSLAATINGAAVLAGADKTQLALSGAIQPHATLAASPTLNQLLSGAIGTQATVSGNARKKAILAGSVAATAVAAGLISRTLELTGAISAASTFHGEPTLTEGTTPGTWIANTPFVSGTGALTPTFGSTGRIAGDFLVLKVESANQAVTTPAGWTLLGTQSLGTAGAAGAVRLTVFAKKSTGAETTVSINDTGDHTSAVGSVYRGIDTSFIQNLLQNSNDLTTTTYWHPYTETTGTPTVVAGNLITITGVTDQTAKGVYTDSFTTLVAGQTYTLLFDAQANSGTQIFAASVFAGGADDDLVSIDFSVSTTKTRFKHTVTMPVGTNYTNLAFVAGSALAPTAVKITNVQLVPGDVDTSYPYLATTNAALISFLGVTIAGQTQAATTSVSFAGLTTPENNSLVLNILANDRDAASTTNLSSVTNASLTDLTKRFDETVIAGQGGGLALITGVRATAGTVSSTTATNAASVTNASMTIALAPAPHVVVYLDAWNTAALEASDMTFSINDRTVVGNDAGGTGDNRVYSTASKSSGKWFASVSLDAREYGDVSITDSDDLKYVHYDYAGVVYSSTGTTLATLAGYTAPCIIDFAFDLDAHLVWFRVNGGNWNGSSGNNPATGTGGYALPTSALPYHVKVQMPFYADSQRTLNTGSAAFTYAAPSGFTPLQT